MTSEDASARRALEEHVHRFFDGRMLKRRDASDRARMRVPGLLLLEVTPGEPGETWTYLTVGASDVPSEPRLEFVLATRDRQTGRAGHLLSMTVYYHASTDTSQRLGFGHTVPIGQPWLGASACDCFLVSKPYPYGPSLEVFDAADRHAHFAWLLPITESERQFAVRDGVEALEQRFDDEAIEFWDPARPPVA